MQCLCGCGVELESARPDAKYATPYCRVRAARKSVSSEPVSSTKRIIQNDTDSAPNDTDKSISPNIPCQVPVQSTGLRLDTDLHLDLRRDLGITAWSPDGIFIRSDITISQVQSIARLIHAKHGRPCPQFRGC